MNTTRMGQEQDPEPNGGAGTTGPAVSGSRRRFLDACACRTVDRAPVWLMRQAGRSLPEYRELRRKHSFVELVQTPELATEVTLQPVRRFGVDAAILFSDILVVPEALGQGYSFREAGGIAMEFTIERAEDLDRLRPEGAPERLRYVADALRMLRRELAGRQALIGFCGSPWTLANFMLQGGSSRQFDRALALLREDPSTYTRLAAILTQATIAYLNLQIEAGAEVLQIFDTLGHLAAGADFEQASGRWLKEIVRGVNGRVPVIVFAKGVNDRWPALGELGAQVLGVDHTVRLSEVKSRLPSDVAVQGNLDPRWLVDRSPTDVAAETRRILEDMRGVSGHVFNLGHGVPPAAELANLEALIDSVQRFK